MLTFYCNFELNKYLQLNNLQCKQLKLSILQITNINFQGNLCKLLNFHLQNNIHFCKYYDISHKYYLHLKLLSYKIFILPKSAVVASLQLTEQIFIDDGESTEFIATIINIL